MTPTGSIEAGDPTRTAGWYACYTKGRHEKRVAERLQERGVDVFLPLVPRSRRWHDREAVVAFPLFPSYVFVRCRSSDLAQALATPGVVSIVQFDGRPVVIPDWEIESVRRLAESLADGDVEAEPAAHLARGEPVEVISGPLEGVRGTVLEHRGAERVVLIVGVSAIAQGLRIEVERPAVRSLKTHEPRRQSARPRGNER